LSAHLILTFGTDNGKTKAFRIPNAKNDLNGGSVLTAMTFMRNSNAFLTKNGELTSANRAVLVETGRRQFDVS